MRERLSDYQEMYGDLYNLEATPAESTTYRLAKHDVELYPDIITAAKKPGDTPYYTNSSHLPVGYTADIFEALAIQDDLQTLYTSGTVFHAFLGEKLPDWKTAAALVRKIAETFKLPYYRSLRTGKSMNWRTPVWRAVGSVTERQVPPPTPAPPPPPPRRSKRTACTSSPPSLAPTARLPKMSWKRRGSIIPPWMSVSTWIW